VGRSVSAPGDNDVSPPTGSIERLRQLGQILKGRPAGPDADWVRIADLARYHGFAPFLFWRLGEGASERDHRLDVPQEVVDGLRADLYSAAAQGIKAEGQLARVLEALSRADLAAIVIKGAALAAYYPDPSLRLYGDIDIMIPSGQIDLAEQTLYAEGYRSITSRSWWLDRLHHLPPAASESGALPVELHWMDRIHHLPPMISESGGLLVELHWRLDHEEGNGRLPTDDFWTRVMPWMVQGQPALRLDPIDEALYLCHHAVVQHRVHGAFRALFDLSQITASWDLVEWRTLCGRAQLYGLERPIYLMLVLAEQVLDLAVPIEVLSELRPSGQVAEPSQLLHKLMEASGDPEASVSPSAVDGLVRGSLGARLRHLIRHIFLPRSGMAAVYHLPEKSPRIWMTYFWRPIDLLRRYGLSAWRALRGEQGTQAAWRRELWLERWLRGVPDLNEEDEDLFEWT